MTLSLFTLIYLSTLVCVTQAATFKHFTAKFELWHISNQKKGKNEGTIRYSYTDTKTVKILEYENGLIEYYNYSEGAMYRYDGIDCEAVTISNKPDLLFTADTIVDTGVGRCDEVAGIGNVAKLCVRKDVLVRAAYSDGMLIELSEVSKLDSGNPDFSLPEKWKCPKKICTSVVDIVMILDRSGSIHPDGWETLKEFTVNFTKAFSISANTTRIGVVTFGTVGFLELDLEKRADNIINTVNVMEYDDKHYTCIGCGCAIGATVLENSKRNEVDKLAILLSDGRNNRPCEGTCGRANLTASAALLQKQAGVVITISVGTVVDDNEMAIVRTQNPNVKTSFSVDSIDELKTIIDGLVFSSCTSFTNYEKCPVDGICGNRKTYYCPTSCPIINNDKCLLPLDCGSSTNYGCVYKEKVCEPEDGCHTTKCVDGICKSTPIICDEYPLTHLGTCHATSLTSHSCAYTLIDSKCNNNDDCPKQEDGCVESVCSSGTCTTKQKQNPIHDIDLCHTYSCENGNFFKVAIPSPKEGGCSKGTCDPKTGNWDYSELCVTTNPCQIGICVNDVCSFIDDEGPVYTDNESTCYRLYCTKEKGWYKVEIKSARKLDGSECFPQSNFILILVIILSVLFFALIIFLLIVAYLLCRRKRVDKLKKQEYFSRLDEANDNELYESAYGGGANPLFSGDD